MPNLKGKQSNQELIEPRVVEVARWRRQQLSKRLHRRSSRWRSWAALIFGLGCALLWHLGHLADETYLLSLTNPHFWFHLALEGAIAFYAAVIFFIIAGLRG